MFEIGEQHAGGNIINNKDFLSDDEMRTIISGRMVTKKIPSSIGMIEIDIIIHK